VEQLTTENGNLIMNFRNKSRILRFITITLLCPKIKIGEKGDKTCIFFVFFFAGAYCQITTAGDG
jgi:hypothetical protein